MSLKAMTCAMALRGVTASEKLLLLALANYADENMTCYPSHRRLGEDACLTPRTVRTLLAALEGRGMISRVERFRSDGSRSSDSITLHFAGEVAEAISGGAEIISGGVGKSLPGGAEMVSPLTTFEPVIEPVNGTDDGAAPKPPRKRRDGSRFCPEDFEPSPAHREQAASLGLTPGDFERALSRFRRHEFPRPYTDWSRCFANWIDREKPSHDPRHPPRTAKSDHLDAVARAMVAACDRPEGERGGYPPEPGLEGGGGGVGWAA